MSVRLDVECCIESVLLKKTCRSRSSTSSDEDLVVSRFAIYHSSYQRSDFISICNLSLRQRSDFIDLQFITPPTV